MTLHDPKLGDFLYTSVLIKGIFEHVNRVYILEAVKKSVIQNSYKCSSHFIILN